MDKKEIKECLGEVEEILKDPTLIAKNGFTLEQFLAVNEFKIMVLCFYRWRLYPVNKILLELSLDAKDCEEYDYIYDLVADIWLKRAESEIEQVIKEVESEPFE